MATQVRLEPVPRRFDVDDYYRMADAGILREHDRVELIEGQVVEMEPISISHAGAVNELTWLLARRLPDHLRVGVQNPVRLDRWSEPQPDLAVILAEDMRRAHPGPEQSLLVIEVAYSSLRYDRNVKLPLYARHGVPEVWIVDLRGAVVERYDEPAEDGYGRARPARRGEAIEPIAVPGLSLSVNDILGEVLGDR